MIVTSSDGYEEDVLPDQTSAKVVEAFRRRVELVEDAFGGDVDFAQLVNVYTEPVAKGQARYSPGKIVAAKPMRGTVRNSITRRTNGNDRQASEVRQRASSP